MHLLLSNEFYSMQEEMCFGWKVYPSTQMNRSKFTSLTQFKHDFNPFFFSFPSKNGLLNMPYEIHPRPQGKFPILVLPLGGMAITIHSKANVCVSP